jgi:hypothetical protein
MSVYSYKIATLTGGTVTFQNLEALSGTGLVPLTAPKSTFTDYSTSMPLGDGTVRGGGWSVASWHWDFLSKTQRDAIKTYCTAKSAEVYINTRKADLSYAAYKAVMVWPDQEQRIAGRILDLTITFQRLETA